MPVTDASASARALYEARRTGVPIPPFTDADPSLGMADGYAIQRELTALLLADGDRIIGHMVGATSKAMQQLIGIDSPDHGPVLASTVYRDGDTIPLGRFVQPRIEAEIVSVLGERLQGPGVTVTQAHRAIAGAVAAVEIVDSRIEDWRIELADTVADLASNGAMVTSSRVVPLDGIDTRLIGMTPTRNGELIAARRPPTARACARERSYSPGVSPWPSRSPPATWWSPRSTGSAPSSWAVAESAPEGGSRATGPDHTRPRPHTRAARRGHGRGRRVPRRAPGERPGGPAGVRAGALVRRRQVADRAARRRGTLMLVALGAAAGREAWTVEAGDGRVLAVFVVNGEHHVTDARCPHNKGPLAEGSIRDGTTLICP